jgi:hypothetical protein
MNRASTLGTAFVASNSNNPRGLATTSSYGWNTMAGFIGATGLANEASEVKINDLIGPGVLERYLVS